MRNFKGAFTMCVIATLLVAGSAAAGDWEKLGKKTVVFGNAEKADSISAKGDAIEQISFKFSGDWVDLTAVTLNFDDGSSQIIEEPESVKPGLTSEAISIEGGPKAVSSIDFSYKAASSSRQGRATVTALGQ